MRPHEVDTKYTVRWLFPIFRWSSNDSEINHSDVTLYFTAESREFGVKDRLLHYFSRSFPFGPLEPRDALIMHLCHKKSLTWLKGSEKRRTFNALRQLIFFVSLKSQELIFRHTFSLSLSCDILWRSRCYVDTTDCVNKTTGSCRVSNIEKPKLTQNKFRDHRLKYKKDM